MVINNQSNQKASRVVRLIFSLAFFPLGFGGLTIGVGDLVKLSTHKDEHVVMGQILSNESRPAKFCFYRPVLRYQFEWNGRTYVSTNIWKGSLANNIPLYWRDETYDELQGLATGNSVKVFFDSRNPINSSLIEGSKRLRQLLLIFLGTILVGFFAPLIWHVMFYKVLGKRQ